MSTPFEIESFEEYLKTVRDELPEGRKYFRGQTKLLSAGYPLKPSIGRYEAKLRALELLANGPEAEDVALLNVACSLLAEYAASLEVCARPVRESGSGDNAPKYGAAGSGACTHRPGPGD